MKHITFVDGPLNGQEMDIADDVDQYQTTKLRSFLPPLFDEFTYKELVPGYWQVVKSEVKEMGF